MEEKSVVGYRFRPTDEELINHYLKNKILGKLWLIDKAITEININSHDPASFRSLSKIRSNDSTYYFFAPTLYISAKKTARKRSTRCGFWKPTGRDRKIKDKSGNIIGEKKTLVYHLGKVPDGVRTPWIMHEYLIKHWSHPDPESYVICKIKCKGEGDIPSGSEPSQSLVAVISTAPEVELQPGDEENGLFMNDLAISMNEQENLSLPDEFVYPNTLLNDNNNNNANVQPQQTPYLAQDGGDFLDGLLDYEECLPDLDLILQENCNHYEPRKPLSGIIAGYNSDSDNDAESISATSYQGTLSPVDSNKDFQSFRDETLSSSKDLQTSFAELSISQKKPESQLPSNQEVREDLVKTEEATNVYLMNMIIGFIVLMAISGKNTESQLTRSTVQSRQEVKQDTSRTVDAKTHKNPPYVYLMNTIIGLILLVALIRNILSVLSTVKT